ncbi:MAG: DUF3857 domain-containing protein [Flavobacterium sp.]
MPLRIISVLFFLISSSFGASAQNYESGKVTVEELQEKLHPKDTAAPAAVLFKKGRTFFSFTSEGGFTATHVYEFRIKIYKKEGLTWANQKVLYAVNYGNLADDKVAFSDAVTYNLENGGIVKTKLKKEGDFKNEVNSNHNAAVITLPNVKVGSVIEFKYILKSKNITRLPDFDFQYEIPVNYFEYKTEIPEFFIYKTLLVGNIRPEMKSEFVQISQLYASNYKQINSLYCAKDIPALYKEKFVDNISNYKGSIQNELELKRFPGERVVDYIKTWEGVAASIYKIADYEKQLATRGFFSEDLKQLLVNVDSPRKKLDTIFKFVQNRMNCNDKKGYFTEKGIKKAYQERTGNVADINLMLIAMLKAAQIEANPILLSTIENGASVFPNRTIFNYVIGAAEIDGQEILLDATNKFTTPNILPLNVLNWKGRLIKENGSTKEIELIPASPSKSNYTLYASITPNLGKLEGTLKMQKSEYNAFVFRQANSDQKEESYIEKTENDFGGIEIEKYAIENKKEDLSKPVSETIKFTSDKSYDSIGSKIFLNPLLFFAYSSNPFNQEKRQMPVYFGYPKQQRFNVIYEVPEGYAVESLPHPIRVVMEGKVASYTMNVISDEHTIQIKIIQEINKAIFVADDYDMLKDFFQKIIEIQNQKIVLKKI